jgi:hypothetical protein
VLWRATSTATTEVQCGAQRKRAEAAASRGRDDDLLQLGHGAVHLGCGDRGRGQKRWVAAVGFGQRRLSEHLAWPALARVWEEFGLRAGPIQHRFALCRWAGPNGFSNIQIISKL